MNLRLGITYPPMQTSVVIPVWNGESVILDCLQALYANSNLNLLEVICVDNDSADGSVACITDGFPQVKLLTNPVNTGFAGGVNRGIRGAKGELVVLLNQDCMMQAGWLDAFANALAQDETIGIVGCTILNADGSVNHAGAYLEKPLSYGRHLTKRQSDRPTEVEYVTGAVFGITTAVRDAIGLLDEGFFPAYYEEVDYCLRAKRAGFKTVYVPEATAVHHFNNKEWQTDPIRHQANQHAMRYRFVFKQTPAAELDPFFEAEANAIREEKHFEQAISRVLALRQTLTQLDAIFDKRQEDLDEGVTAVHQRHATTGLTTLLHTAFATAQHSSMIRPAAPPTEDSAQWERFHKRLDALQQQEHELMRRIYFRAPGDTTPESTLQRLVRLGIKRPLSFLIGRDYLLQSQLSAVHVARMDQMKQLQRLTERRLTLLETLHRYEYR